ncbi:hypothetical protein ACSSS7_000858 [Eimeria intestinalis]
MYIHEITLDGFKSYSSRVVVGPLHPQFNAITGLNGTGKSNILDSICFVLGISNHSLVRVARLEDLVYKQGQAGVTKATVTIKLKNDPQDPSNPLPPPYKEMREISITRQIIIGGRDRYLLNSRIAQVKEIRDFFQCCQLNINNPHFMIQQGKLLPQTENQRKITKVINMKPKELLGLIEEVSGTRMYEHGVEAFADLQRQRSTLLDELEEADRQKEEAEKQLEALEAARAEKDAPLKVLRKKKEDVEKVCSEGFIEEWLLIRFPAHDALTPNSQNGAFILGICYNRVTIGILKGHSLPVLVFGGAHEVLLFKKNLMNQELSRLHADARSCKRDLDMLKASVKDQEKEEKRLAKALEAHRNSRSTEAAQAEQLAEEVEKARAELQEKSEKLQAVSSGGVGASGSIREALKTKRSEGARLEAQEFSANQELQYLKAERDELEAKEKSACADVQGVEAKAREQRARVAELKLQLEALGNTDGQAAQLQASYAQLQQKHHAYAAEAQEAMQELRAWAKIDVRLPRGLDPARFFGQIFELVSLKEDYLSYSKALQIVMWGGFATYRFDPQRHSKVAEYVFGGSLICRTSAMAQKITYQKNYRFAFPTATEEGDVFQAGGVMAGGSVRDVRQTMLSWKRYKDASANAEETARSIRQAPNCEYTYSRGARAGAAEAIEAQLAPLQARAQQAASLQKSLRLAENQLQNVESLLGSSDAEACRLRLTEVRNLIAAKEELIVTLGTKRKELQKSIRQLEAEIHDLEHNKDKIEANLNKEVKELRAKLKRSEDRLEELQLKTGDVRLQLQTVQQELEGVRADLAARMKKAEELQQQLDLKNAAVKDKEVEHEAIEADLLERATESKKDNQQQMRVAESLKKIAKAKEAKSLALKKEVKQLLAAHEWLVAEEPKFNQAGSPYDFKQLRPETARQRIQQLKADIEKLGKNVNSSAGMLLEKTEAELQTLLNRKAQVEADREKIREVIASLDEKKKNSMKNTWRLVDGNFSAIFEQLLPNAQAKLVQVDTDDLMKGLEMKIAFHHKWKESLSELSGGQRSLLALSLILALLKVKPAPVYILDEVDAALDLSHTQNIGSMIKTQFPTSQFIIVSLKEGMFSHADVLFRTRLVEGTSGVERHALADRMDKQNTADHQVLGSTRKRARKAAAEGAQDEDFAFKR